MSGRDASSRPTQNVLRVRARARRELLEHRQRHRHALRDGDCRRRGLRRRRGGAALGGGPRRRSPLGSDAEREPPDAPREERVIVRYESWGAWVKLETEAAIVALDREGVRALGLDGGAAWTDARAPRAPPSRCTWP